MKKRQIGQSDLFVSEMGLGCMSLGTDRRNAERVIDTAITNGVNFLDTADLYDQGLNEEIIGSFIKSRRQDLVIATKGGNRFEVGKDGWTWDPSKRHLKQAVKDSLRRLQIDYIDLYQLHGGTIEDNIEETIEAMEELKKEGAIRYYGISSIRPNVISEYIQRSNIVSVMMQYSLLDRRPEELFPYLQKHQVSILTRGSLAKGILTNHNLQAKHKSGYLQYTYEDLLAFREQLKKVIPHQSLHSTALQFCLTSPVVASLIVGASTERQFLETATALSEKNLLEADIQMLMNITKQNRYEQHTI